MKIIVVSSFCLVLIQNALALEPVVKPSPLPMEAIEGTIDASDGSKYIDLPSLKPGAKVIRDEKSWEDLWKRSKAPGPEIEFDTSMVIVLTWKRGRFVCTSNVEAIESIEQHSDRIEVKIKPIPKEVWDRENCRLIQVVKIKQNESPVVFTGVRPK